MLESLEVVPDTDNVVDGKSRGNRVVPALVVYGGFVRIA